MQFTVLVHSLLQIPDRARLTLQVFGPPFTIELTSWDSATHLIEVPDLPTLSIRLDAHFSPSQPNVAERFGPNLKFPFGPNEEVVSAFAETSGARGISIVQSVPDSLTARLLHAERPAMHQCKVRCPNGDWIYGQPGGTCVECTTASGKKLTLCC